TASYVGVPAPRTLSAARSARVGRPNSPSITACSAMSGSRAPAATHPRRRLAENGLGLVRAGGHPGEERRPVHGRLYHLAVAAREPGKDGQLRIRLVRSADERGRVGHDGLRPEAPARPPGPPPWQGAAPARGHPGTTH